MWKRPVPFQVTRLSVHTQLTLSENQRWWSPEDFPGVVKHPPANVPRTEEPGGLQSIFFFWDSYDVNDGVFNIVPEVSEVVLISFNSFFFFPLCFICNCFLKASHFK